KEVQGVESVNLQQVLEETMETFIGAYGREIKLELDETPIFVQGNRDQLKQVFYILVDNALKYSDSTVNVSIEKQDNQVIISVTDYGAGIPKEEISRLFERFYRVDKARSRNTGGTGLGLAIAKTIINSHGGTIEVDSEIGVGTTF